MPIFQYFLYFGKFRLFFTFVLRRDPLGPFLHTLSSCQDLQLRFSLLFLCRYFTYSAMLPTDDFHAQFDKFLQCFLLVVDHRDLSSSVITFSSLRKTFHPLVNCCFLHSVILVNLHYRLSDFASTLAKFNKKFNIRSLL